MKAVVLDAYALTLPKHDPLVDPAVLKERFDAYLGDILSWKALSDYQESFHVYSNEDIAACLADAGDYPLWDVIDQRIAQFQLGDEYQTKDVFDVLSAFLVKYECIEDAIGVEDVLVDSFDVKPADIKHERAARYIDHLGRLAGLLSIYDMRNDTSDPMVATARIEPAVIDSRLTGEIIEVVSKTQFEMPINIDIHIALGRHFECAISRSDALALWNLGTSEAMRTALLCVLACKTSLTEAKNALVNCVLGEELCESARALGFLHDGKKAGRLIDAILETATCAQMRNTHALRTGKGPNDSQVTRDGYCAWRRDIDDEFHLHYWAKGQRVVIANVVVHNDFSIPW